MPDLNHPSSAHRKNLPEMKKMPNPITYQIRAIRHELAAQFDNDLDRIVADLQRQQRESG